MSEMFDCDLLYSTAFLSRKNPEQLTKKKKKLHKNVWSISEYPVSEWVAMFPKLPKMIFGLVRYE